MKSLTKEETDLLGLFHDYSMLPVLQRSVTPRLLYKEAQRDFVELLLSDSTPPAKKARLLMNHLDWFRNKEIIWGREHGRLNNNLPLSSKALTQLYIWRNNLDD